MTDRFLDQLVEARLDAALLSAAQGATLLVRARRAGTWDALQRRIVEGAMGRELAEVTIGPRPQEELIAAASAAGAASATLAGIVRAPELRWVCFVADARAAPPDVWLRLAGTFASARAEAGAEGPALVIRLTNGEPPNLCRLLDDGDFVGPAESMVFARARQMRTGLLAEAAAAAAIEVARGDLQLLEQLLTLTDAERFDPCAWATRQDAAAVPMPLLWRDREEECPAWLAHHDMPRLRRRVWRGQVSVLLPWLADCLAEFMRRHGRRLPQRLESRDGDLVLAVDYEWSEVSRLLRTQVPNLGQMANELRLARNELAHGRPIAWNVAVRLPECAQRLLNWK